MALGYDEQRPRRKNYNNFVEKLTRDLGKSGVIGLSVMFYGSYARKTYNPGKSDIDSIVIFNDSIVINKWDMTLVSNIIADAQRGNDIPLQFTVSDLYTMVQGTFNTYDDSYKESINKDGVMVHGPDYRREFTYVKPHLRQHSELKFNLRKSRTNYLMSEYLSEKNYSTFIDKFSKSLDAMTNCSRQILLLNSHVKFDREKFTLIDNINRIYPQVDIEPLKKIKYYNDDLVKMDALYHDKLEVMKLWRESLTCMEEILKAYINPEFRERVLESAKKSMQHGMYPHNLQ